MRNNEFLFKNCDACEQASLGGGLDTEEAREERIAVAAVVVADRLGHPLLGVLLALRVGGVGGAHAHLGVTRWVVRHVLLHAAPKSRDGTRIVARLKGMRGGRGNVNADLGHEHHANVVGLGLHLLRMTRVDAPLEPVPDGRGLLLRVARNEVAELVAEDGGDRVLVLADGEEAGEPDDGSSRRGEAGGDVRGVGHDEANRLLLEARNARGCDDAISNAIDFSRQLGELRRERD